MSGEEGAGVPRPPLRIGRRIAQLVLTVVVTWFILDRIGVSMGEVRDLGPEWWRPRFGPLTIATLTLFAAYIFSGVLWVGMTRELGSRELTLSAGIGIYLVANLGRYVPGKVWQVLGLAYMSARKGVDPTIATGAAALAHLLSLCGASLVGSLALLRGPAEIRAISPYVIAVVGGSILLTLSRSFMALALRGWSKLLRGARPPSPPSRTFGVRWAAAFTVHWLLYGIAFTFFVRAFVVSGDWLMFLSGFVAAYLLGYVALFAPAGIGVREAVLVAILSPAIGVGAVAVAAWSRLWLTAVEVLSALLVGGSTLRRARSASAKGSHV